VENKIPIYLSMSRCIQLITDCRSQIIFVGFGSRILYNIVHVLCLHFYCTDFVSTISVLFFSPPRSEGWPHHRRTFSIYLYPLSFWLSSTGVLSMPWCCPSKPFVVFLVCMHRASFLALSLSPSNSVVSSWCDYNMLVSLLWQYLKVPSLLREPTHLFSLLSMKPAESSLVLSAQRRQVNHKC